MYVVVGKLTGKRQIGASLIRKRLHLDWVIMYFFRARSELMAADKRASPVGSAIYVCNVYIYIIFICMYVVYIYLDRS